MLPGRMEPDLGVLKGRLENEWRLLCERAGFAMPGQQPPMPGNARQLLLSSDQVFRDMVMAHTRDTLLTPIRPYLALSPIPSPELHPRPTEERAAQEAARMLDSITLGAPGRTAQNASRPGEAVYTAEM